jgi:hypothetical protein
MRIIVAATLVALPFVAASAVTPSAVRLSAQTRLDRVVARVGTESIFETDIKAALGLGIVEPLGTLDPEAAALEELIDRQLMLTEILRGVPPEPDAAAVDEEVQRMRNFAAGTLKTVMTTNGIDDVFLRRAARDTLRIQLYLDMRFPELTVSDAEAQQYYNGNPSAFRRNGVLMTFEQAIGAARDQASRDRRAARIRQWLEGLRRRTEITRPAAG